MKGKATIKTDRRGHRTFWLDGKRLPSPSTVVNRWKDSGGLIYWANQQGLEGVTLDEARRSATTPGTIVHEMIECDIRGREFDRDGWSLQIVADGLDADATWALVDASWAAYQDWRRGCRLELIASEVSLVSEAHRFGGTFDAVGVHDWRSSSALPVLIDWKTGALYPDHLLQMGGYIVLWEENMEDPIDGIVLLSISKEHGGFTHLRLPRAAMQVAVDQFLALREALDRDKMLRKMV
jgi:hypothetical protein